MLLELYFENGKSRLPAVLLALVQIFFKHMTDKLSVSCLTILTSRRSQVILSILIKKEISKQPACFELAFFDINSPNLTILAKKVFKVRGRQFPCFLSPLSGAFLES